MIGKPEPGDVLLWRGSHDVLGTRDPVILVEPATDPQFWVVAELDEQGAPTPYTFAVPLEDLVPVEDRVPESSTRGTPWLRGDPARGTPWLRGDPARGALPRIAVSLAAAASFALGALFLIGHQPLTQVAEGLRPAATSQVPNAPELRDQPSDRFQAASSLVGGAAVASRADTDASALGRAGAVGGASRGGAGGGGAGSGGSSGGGSSGGSSGGGVAAPDTHPGNSGSAPGQSSTRGNSGSAPGQSSTRGNSGSAPGHK